MKNQIDDLGVVGVVVEDWDISREYKAKTITTDYSTWIAYISRKNVPAYTPITDIEYWKPLTRLQTELALDYNNFKEYILAQFGTLDKEVKSFLHTTEPGTALSDSFGMDEMIGINQKAITDAINKIWQKLELLSGETYQGIVMTVTPTYFIGEDGCRVHITARTTEANGIFEEIALYANGMLLVKDSNKDYLEFDTFIDETTVIKCDAQIMGVPYTRQETIVHYNSFWLGVGSTYEDVMTVEHVIPITNGMRGAYDVTVEKDGDYIIIIVGDNLKEGFIRADMNGMEIPMTESTVMVEDNSYTVFRSVNGFMAGTYNIDING